MTFSDVINIKIIVAMLGSIVALVAFILPLKNTYIPLKRYGFASPELKYRLFTRFMVFAILVHEWALPLYARINSDGRHGFDDQLFSAASIPIIVIFIISVIITWQKHPQGASGL